MVLAARVSHRTSDRRLSAGLLRDDRPGLVRPPPGLVRPLGHASYDTFGQLQGIQRPLDSGPAWPRGQPIPAITRAPSSTPRSANSSSSTGSTPRIASNSERCCGAVRASHPLARRRTCTWPPGVRRQSGRWRALGRGQDDRCHADLPRRRRCHHRPLPQRAPSTHNRGGLRHRGGGRLPLTVGSPRRCATGCLSAPGRRQRFGQHGVAAQSLSTAAAAGGPSAIAHTISDWPRPMSPAANTPGTESRTTRPSRRCRARRTRRRGRSATGPARVR